MKIFYKFLIVMLFLSAVPLVIVGYRLIDINQEGLKDVIMELHTEKAVSVSDSIERYMNNLTEKIKFVIAAHGKETVNWTLTQRVLKSLIASSEELLTVSAVTVDGKELTKVYHDSLEGEVKLKDRSKDNTFIQAKKEKSFAVSSVYYVNNQPRMNIVYPFHKDLFLYIETSLQRLLDRVEKTTIGKTGFSYIVNDKGKIIMHPDVSRAKKGEAVSDRPIVKEVLSRKLEGSKEYITKDGKRVVGAYSPVAALGWGVVIQQDKQEAYLSVAKMRRSAFVLLIAAILAACILGYFMTHNLTSPIRRLTSASRNIASGEFNAQPVLGWLKKVKIRDEMAELASTFVVMTRQLKKYNEMQADKMNAILFSIADGIIMTDYSGKVILSNKRAKELFGIKRSEVIEGRNISQIIKKDVITQSLSQARREKENIVKEIELEKDEKPKILRTDTSLVSHSESGEELGVVTVVRDITLEKEIEQLKDDFIHSITHDLRSPMTSIRGFLEFLIDGTAGEINEQQREFLEIIDRSSERLLGMINNILDVARMESGNMPVKITNINMKKMAESVVKSLKSQAQKNNIKLTIKADGQGGNLNADKSLISRVMVNLISNALKYTPAEGDITVSIEDMDDRVRVSVKDTGEGMPPEYVEKVFDKFEQVKKSRDKKRGSGLGLTITKYIVEVHKGKIWAESELGEGSVFNFWIPKGLQKDQFES
ncbi:MAG: ATP-binding protein [Elusimicrobiota bacterium]